MQGLNGTRWDAPITLTLGDAEEGNTNLTKHFIADNVLIAYNTLVDNSHGIEIGFDNNGKYGKDLKDITIANNLITGSENALVAIKDNNDQGSNITWQNNLFAPTGTATTIVNATSTTFTDAMVKDENPFLVSESYNDYTVWRTTASTPNYNNAVLSETINQDIEGQDRPSNSNPGADHFSTISERFMPLKPVDVGPDAYETNDNTESLFLSTITGFTAVGETKLITVTANVDWTVTDDADWISVTPNSGSNSGSFNVTTSANSEFTERTGKVTVVGGAITRLLNITQAAADPKANLELINDQSANDNVSINYVFAEEITATKNNLAIHTLDNDLNTQWAGNGVGGEIIYDLGGIFNLQLIDFATTNGKTYKFQIWVSKTGTTASDFENVFPNDGDLLSNSDGTYKSLLFPSVAIGAKYVKIIGNGQTSGSTWNTIKEVDFYKTSNLSVNNTILDDEIVLYPNPTNNILNIKVGPKNVAKIELFNIIGRKVLETKIDTQSEIINIDVSKLAKGSYFVVISENNGLKTSKNILVK
jgi:hypothetical protein